MSNFKIIEKAGLLKLETLFKGSKSEGLYPVLITEDGKRFRIHIKENQLNDSLLLANFDGQIVCLTGYVDEIKGHSRIVISSDLCQSVDVVEKNNDQGNVLDSDADPQTEIDKRNFEEKP